MKPKKPKLYRDKAEQTRVRKSQSNARRDRAGVSDIKRLRDNARRLERRVGITKQKRMLSDKELAKLTKEERQKVAKEYSKRLQRAENLAKQGVKIRRVSSPAVPTPTPPTPSQVQRAEEAAQDLAENPEQVFVQSWEEYDAWDDFKDWLAKERGIYLDPDSELYWQMRELSIQLGAENLLHSAEQFSELVSAYESRRDVVDLR